MMHICSKYVIYYCISLQDIISVWVLKNGSGERRFIEKQMIFIRTLDAVSWQGVKRIKSEVWHSSLGLRTVNPDGWASLLRFSGAIMMTFLLKTFVYIL